MSEAIIDGLLADTKAKEKEKTSSTNAPRYAIHTAIPFNADGSVWQGQEEVAVEVLGRNGDVYDCRVSWKAKEDGISPARIHFYFAGYRYRMESIETLPIKKGGRFNGPFPLTQKLD